MKSIVLKLDDMVISQLLRELKFKLMVDDMGGSALTEFAVLILTSIRENAPEVTITMKKRDAASVTT
jgi:hypothetical protein